MELWIHELANRLVTEVSRRMANIQLKRTDAFPWEDLSGEHVVVYGLIQGDYELHVQLLTEFQLLDRLTSNMLGAKPAEDDVREYTLEYFNTICGRFISEIINQTHISEKLISVQYEMPFQSPILTSGEQVSTEYFLSDRQEPFVFSWTSMPISNMMRSEMNG